MIEKAHINLIDRVAQVELAIEVATLVCLATGCSAWLAIAVVAAKMVAALLVATVADILWEATC